MELLVELLALGRVGIKLKAKSINYPAVYTDNLQLTSKAAEHQIGQASYCADWAPEFHQTRTCGLRLSSFLNARSTSRG